ncbi:hypothetical protein B7H23_04690 [Notoacmeibacter marinus]|uniref:Uncharacterized protein n=1 Tax=Notoacmeibacter marinus TaxID=1876515 RepID=A0A231V3S9_9HYPH|nr:hypothetical protein [Notoacmeibacter marinus]OXT02216.1 hypothetical protein B7H23_04690 [Notoacmeibacter marinus]
MTSEKHGFEIDDGLAVTKKKRRLKYDWDTQVIEDVKRLLRDDPSQSRHAALTEVLNRTLNEDERVDFVSHHRRISDRMKLF